MRVYAKMPPDAKLKLQLQVQNLQAKDKVLVTLNGKLVSNLRRSDGGWLIANIEAGQVRFGENQIDLQLKPTTMPTAPRTATALELHVAKQKP